MCGKSGLYKEIIPSSVLDYKPSKIFAFPYCENYDQIFPAVSYHHISYICTFLTSTIMLQNASSQFALCVRNRSENYRQVKRWPLQLVTESYTQFSHPCFDCSLPINALFILRYIMVLLPAKMLLMLAFVVCRKPLAGFWKDLCHSLPAGIWLLVVLIPVSSSGTYLDSPGSRKVF